MKLVYSDPKTGKTGQAEVKKEMESMLQSKQIGEEIDGMAAGLTGFKLKITGLSDNTGTPSRPEISGTRKARPLLGSGIGIRKAKHGHKERRLARGSAVGPDTAQVNTVILEFGSIPAEELFKPKEKKEQ